ncbi:PAS domain-containing protein [Hyalangium rubrum]|uniref:histidine kinase n=1 Tax=Hyalangium rubrum TaxID=3103134 RepID=A0ABU5H0R0_9BACT|nr:PAS domain-containing protein [Hyalangium sp. s54d21]MDY7227029.1 PAS domain-containing protein [Hyalangium sp. s54d21]
MDSVSQRLAGTSAASLVREQKDQILQRWEQRVLREIYASGAQDRPALIDSLPDFLEQLACTLTAPTSSSQADHNAQVARLHGEERSRHPDYTLGQLIHEYHVLREVLVDTLAQQQGLAPEALRILHAFIDQCTREAATRFAERAQEKLGRIEQSAKAKEHELDQLFARSAGPMVFFSGPDFVYERVNARYLEILRDRHILGKPVMDAVPELSTSEFPTILKSVFETGKPVFVSEGRVDIQDKQTGVVHPRYFDAWYFRIEDLEGKPSGIFHSATEVTERVLIRQEAQRTAQALRISEQRLAEALAVSGAGTWEVELGTQEVLADRRFREMFGLTQDEPFSLAKGLAIIHPEDAPTVAAAVADAIAGKNGGHYEADYRTVPRADGRYQWVAARGQTYFDAHGKALRFVGTGVDITARKLAEAEREAVLARERAARAEAEAERQKLYSLFMQAPMAICIQEGPEHTYTLANPLYRELVGGRDVVGKTLREALPDIEGQGFDKLLDGVLTQGVPFFGKEVPVKFARHAEGEAAILNFVYAPMRNAAGQVYGVLTAATDVTEQVQAREVALKAAEKLRESEQRRALALEVSGAGTWELDLSTHQFIADERMRVLFGLSLDEPFDLKRLLSILPPEEAAVVERGTAEALAGRNGGASEAEYRTIFLPDGRRRWVSARGQVYFDAAGKPLRFLGTVTDITAQKDLDAARTSLLASIADQSVFGVAVLRGPELRFELANEGYRKSVGNREVLGKGLLEALPELAGQGADVQLLETLRTGKAFTGREVRYWIDSEGKGRPEPRAYNFTWQPIRTMEGKMDSILVLTHDVTEGVRAREREAELAREALARAEFEQHLIGIVSHDLRNPLSAIQLGATLLSRREDMDGRALKAVVRIQTSAERAIRMVKDLLDFTQARVGGGFPLTLRPMDLHELIRSTVEEVEIAHLPREVQVRSSGDGRGTWDVDRLGQLVQNLITNALKYSPEDTPVRVTTRGEDGEVMLSVQNEGAPIPPERFARLFQPMQRGMEGVDKATRSVGLGLYIVRAIVEAHHGDITVSSTEETGTTFTVRLPRVVPAATVTRLEER